MKIAAIDIGSNAARLLINEVLEPTDGDPVFTKLNLLRIPLRLGIDVFNNGKIGKEREKLTIDTMKIFRDLMEIYEVEHYRACATSAMRDAENGQEIIKKVKKKCDINIEIISGDEEASLIYENHIAETLSGDFGYLYIDVGGGSTEIMYFINGKMLFKKSFNIGTIRLLNNLVTEEMWNDMEQSIKKNIGKDQKIYAIGSGGNINKVFSLSKTSDGTPLSLESLKTYLKEFSSLNLTERMQKYNLREDRADVLIPALTIFDNVMTWAGISNIYVPKISVADGLIHNIYDQIKSTK